MTNQELGWHEVSGDYINGLVACAQVWATLRTE
jgi:hypothetical protein